MQTGNDAGVPVSLERDPPVPEAVRSSRTVDPALTGCFLVLAAFAIPAFVYFGFFAFALMNGWYGWGLLEPWVDERTGEFLEAIYWPLIVLCEYAELI